MDTYTLVKEWKKRTRLDPIRESRKIKKTVLKRNILRKLRKN